jgi:hypothetical protein
MSPEIAGAGLGPEKAQYEEKARLANRLAEDAQPAGEIQRLFSIQTMQTESLLSHIAGLGSRIAPILNTVERDEPSSEKTEVSPISDLGNTIAANNRNIAQAIRFIQDITNRVQL